MTGSYLGRVARLFNASEPQSCWAFFDKGSIDGVNQTLGWKRLNGGCSTESSLIFVALAAEAKSDEKFVAINFTDDEITKMWVFEVSVPQ